MSKRDSSGSIKESVVEVPLVLDRLPMPMPPMPNIVKVWRGDITTLKIDCIVNAANKSLLGGGGVDGAIHAAAGHKLYEECKALGGAKTGQCKITQAYLLPSKHVIHAVGPIGEKPALLASCYRNALRLAVENGLRQIAFCSISTGIYGYPMRNATRVALATVSGWLSEQGNANCMDMIIFCVFSKKDHDIYMEHVADYFPDHPFTSFAYDVHDADIDDNDDGVDNVANQDDVDNVANQDD